MWKFNEKDLDQDVVGSGYLRESGCHICIITKLTMDERKVVFEIETESGEKVGTIFHYYTKKDGTEIPFKVRHLNHLLYLNKLRDPAKLQTVVGKRIGVMLKAELSQDGKFINFNIDGFYQADLGKTAKELKEGLPAETVKKMTERYAAETPLKPLKTKNTSKVSRITADTEFAEVGELIDDEEEISDFPF